MSRAKVVLPEEGLQTTIQSSNYTYHSDEPIEAGGTGTAPSPTEMVMGALGSCIANDHAPLCRPQRLGA